MDVTATLRMTSTLRFQGPVSLLAVAALAGCMHTRAAPAAVSRSGEVGVSDISDFAMPSGRLVLARNETFFLPLPAAGNALPGYPPSLLVQRLAPQVVCLEIGVGAHGEVMTALPIAATAQCPVEDPGLQAAADPRFLDAARGAVLGWRFDAAFRCEYPTDAARMRQDCSGGRETPQAVSLAYRFIFQQRDGRGSVRASGDAEGAREPVSRDRRPDRRGGDPLRPDPQANSNFPAAISSTTPSA